MAIEGGSWLFLIVLVLLVHETWSTAQESTQQRCAPSSCGNIHKISYPFSLKGSDPENCGDPRYKLSCENNQTVLYLYDGKYNVREINYSYYRIRISDSGIQEHNNYSFIPHYFLSYENFSKGDPYVIQVVSKGFGEILSKPATFVNCQKPANSSIYVNISACFNSSKRYRYVQVEKTTPADVEESCQVEQMSLTTGKTSYPENVSCTDVHNNMSVYGFELSWHQVYCGSCAGRHDICYLDYANNVLCYTLHKGALRMREKRNIF